MNRKGLIGLVTLLSAVIGLACFGNIQRVSAQPLYWEEHYRHEYKVEVLKPIRINRVIYGKYTYQNKWVNGGRLHKGSIVRTWYAGIGGFDWHLTGGPNGRYDITSKYGYNVSWPSKHYFKILKVYHGYHWF
jgi:hypothetical protein